MSKLTVYDRACLYAAKIPAAVSGSGGHNATFTVACALVKGFDLPIDEARMILNDYNARCHPPWTPAEIEHKLKQADTIPDEKARGWLRDAGGTDRDDAPAAPRQAGHAPSAPLPAAITPKPTFQAETLARFAARWRNYVDTLWLAERSPIVPYNLPADEFLRAVFREGEKVVVFTNDRSQGQAIWPLEQLPAGARQDLHTPPEQQPGDIGAWFLSQPVDGLEHPKEGADGLSRRSKESVTDWRHLVIESDEANARDWLGALVQLPLRIVAIYTSGGRSIHVLARIDAASKEDWDNTLKQILPILVTLGGDRKAMTAVRLTRLPGAWRHGKRDKEGNYIAFPAPKLQKLLWLDPDPEPLPICARPKLRSLLEPWLAWLPTALSLSPADVYEQGGWPMIEDVERTLAWYESAPAARAQLAALRAWKDGR